MSSNSLLTPASEPPKYANTYRLEPINHFNSEKVDNILKEIMLEALENLNYDPEQCAKQAKWASLMIKSKVKELNFDRYKIISIVSIGEKHDHSLTMVCKFFWDSDKDGFSSYTTENTHVYGVALCFGLYYE
ncbi:dynein light chain Tctex-type 5-A [Diabrotica virgifera virgifera]|uniref:Tctex1 domain-containing protein 1-like n=1 Tax=Diabrotica virgifera virgifera TaxID=50390 RepID=A0ABM5JQX9_DIAVI|nr:dynein light chain Tctex-type 5-A [Diabrotica virgifera virgifera]